MTFLKGQTTWEQFGPRLIAMICGEQGDDAGTVVAVADRWTRDPNVAAGTHSIVSPASTAFTPPTFNHGRVGYFTALANPLSYQRGVAPADWGLQNVVTSHVRVKTCFTAPPPYTYSDYVTRLANTYRHRWLVQVVITTANTTPGDYSTARCWIRCFDANHNKSNGEYSNEAYFTIDNLVPTADGTVTPGANYPGFTFQIGDPSGTVKTYQNFMRLFTDDTLGPSGVSYGGYWGGIDFWPHLWRRTGVVQWETGLVPPGVEGTDWAVTEDQIIPTHSQWSRHRYGWTFGLGVKTNAALANAVVGQENLGPRYGVRWPMAQGKFHFTFYQSGTENGSVLMWPGASRTDAPGVMGFVASIGGYDPVRWLRPFVTPGSVNPTAPVQFWVRVTAKDIIVCVNADPGFTGTTSVAWIASLTPFSVNAGIESFPMVWQGWHTAERTFDDTSAWRHGSYQHQNSGWQSAPHMRTWGSHWGFSLYQNGFREGGRDWQTGWLRSDFGTGKTWYVVLRISSESTSDFAKRTRYGTQFLFEMDGDLNAGHYDQAVGYGHQYAVNLPPIDEYESGPWLINIPNTETHPHPYKGDWRLYAFAYIDRRAISTYAWESSEWNIRGYFDNGIYYLPGNNWASADELVDNATGDVFFLYQANYHQVLTRGYSSPAAGLAIREV